MPKPIELDRRFRKLLRETIRGYEKELKKDTEQHERWAKPRKQREEQVREILRASQIDLERLDRLIKEDEQLLQEFLHEVRPPLVERPSRQAENAKRLAQLSGLSICNRNQATVYAATLLAADSANLEGNPGRQGNPWILPLNPGLVKIKARSQGQGWGCYALGPTYGPSRAAAVFWFLFVPEKTATWNLLPLVNLHGFYILRADDDWWNCKHCQTRVEASVNVYQYYWNGEKRFSLLDIGAGNINEARLFNEYGQFDYQAGLRAGDLAFVKVTISINVYAQGGGSFSEVNFSDGIGNFIEPLIVAAWAA
jgi:hypothetical protein